MNYSEFLHITQHLNFRLCGAQVEQIADGNCKIQMGFKLSNTPQDSHRRYFIVADFKASHLDLYPTQTPQKSPAVPQAFTMLMRKYLMGMSVLAVRLATDDRIVFIEFGQEDTALYTWIIEFTGNAPKIFLVDAENNSILGMIGDDEIRLVHSEYQRPAPHLFRPCTDRFQNLESTEYETALDQFYTSRDKKEYFTEEYTKQNKRLKSSLTKTNRLIDSLNADLDKIELAKHEKIEADILNAYAWQVKKGAAYVELPDFETGKHVHIQLDPSLSVRGNIDKMYSHSKRLLKAQPQIESKLTKAKQRLNELNKMVNSFSSVQCIQDIKLLLPDIDKLCLTDEKSPSASRRPTARVPNPVHLPFKTFTSADGTKILVGKSASDNDDLTFHHARGNDTWLHVCQVPGSHVIVKHPNPTQETLLDAALLALHYSKIAQSSSAEIHVTQVKYVRKPKGAPAGKVEIRGEHAILIKKDEKRLSRLLATL